VLATGSDTSASPEFLKIIIDDGTAQYLTVPAGSTTWSYTSPTSLALGSHDVGVVVMDAAGNYGTPVEQTVTVDNTASNISAAAAVLTTPVETATLTAISPDTGTSATDFVTGNGNLTFSGTLSSAPVNGETVQISLDGGQNWDPATVNSAGSTPVWSFDNTAHTLPDGLYVVQARVLDAAGNPESTTAQQVEVSSSGTLNLSLQDVLSDASALTNAGSTQQITINNGGGVVSTVNLTDGVGTAAGQWQDTGTTTVNGVTYDIYHNAAQGASTLADLLIQQGIHVI
jgi:hypothetical protein